MNRYSALKTAALIVCLAPSYLAHAGSDAEATAQSADHAELGEVIGKSIYGLVTDFQQDPVLLNERVVLNQQRSGEFALDMGEVNFTLEAFGGDIGAIYLSKFNDKGNRVTADALDGAGVGGVSELSAGAWSPWNTLLFSESPEINIHQPGEFVERFKPYFKHRAEMVNPYNYGWVVEAVVLDSAGSSKLVKQYGMGRIAAHQVLAMPDGKTIYLLDKQGYLFAFIADEANSMTKGRLYAVDVSKSKPQLQLLAKSSALKNKFKLKKMSFSQLFKTKDAADVSACNKPYHLLETPYGRECLAVANARYAGVFEPQRLAMIKGISGFGGNAIMQVTPNKHLRLTAGELSREFALISDETTGSEFLVREKS
jgi:hypothetical protein